MSKCRAAANSNDLFPNQIPKGFAKYDLPKNVSQTFKVTWNMRKCFLLRLLGRCGNAL